MFYRGRQAQNASEETGNGVVAVSRGVTAHPANRERIEVKRGKLEKDPDPELGVAPLDMPRVPCPLLLREQGQPLK